jgi:transcriptional regulator NrdR family protein
MTATKTKLTTTQIKDYLASPVHCPYCNSTNIEARGDRDVDHDGVGILREQIDCLDCEKSWYDVYRLKTIEEVKP